MSNYDKRHIIEVPMSRVKTNKDLEYILNLTKINEIEFTKDEIIILFDEIDQGTDEITENKNTDKDISILTSLIANKSDKPIRKNNDELNLGCILSRLDG